MLKTKAIFFGLTALIILLDQLSKALVTNLFSVGESIFVWGSFFKLTYVLNQGGAFGTKLGGNIFYSFTSVLAIILTLYFFLKAKKEKLLELSLCLILGGALGNLIDRVRLGEVIDFFDFDFFNINFLGYHLDRWPVFNLADAAVTIGMLLLLIYFFKPKSSPALSS